MKLSRPHSQCYRLLRNSPSQNNAKKLLLALSFLCAPVSISAERLVVPTAMVNQYGGQLSTRYLKRVSDDKETGNNTSEFINTAEVGWRNIVIGYLYKPWFGTWSGNTTARLSWRWQSGEQFTKSSLTSMLGDTSWTLNLFPISKFPFKAQFELSHNNEEKDYQDELVTRYLFDLSQRYVSPNSKTNARANIKIQGRDSEVSGKTSDFEIGLAASQVLGPHVVQGEMKYNLRGADQTSENKEDDTIDELQKNQQLNLFFRHRYNPLQSLSIENFASFFTDEEIYEFTQRERINWQINSNTIWRPELEPRLTVSGGARVSGNESTLTNERNPGSDTEQLNFSLYSGATFDYTSYIRFNAGLNINASKSDSETALNTNQRIGVTYSPETINWNQYEYNWYTSGTATNNTSDEETYQDISGTIGQSIKRDFPFLQETLLNLNISNQFTTGFSTQSDSENRSTLRNRISLSHNFKEDGFYSNSRIAYDDEWGIGGVDSDIKNRHRLSLLFNGNYELKSSAFLYGDLNLELVREDKVSGESKTSYFSSGYIAYRNPRFFNVFRLQFISRLSLSMEDVLSRDVIEEEELFGDEQLTSTVWENRLNYQLGRFLFSSRLSFTQSDDKTNGLFMLEMKRRFGFY